MRRSCKKLISLVLVVMLVLTSLTLVPTSVAAAEEEEYTFQYIDNQNWEDCYLYVFNDDGDVGTTWPGISLESFGVNDSGEKLYEIHVPAGATGVVLNNMNGQQTVNIVDFDVTGYYATGERDDQGHLLVVSWTDEPATEDSTEPETEPETEEPTEPETAPYVDRSFLFNNYVRWSYCYVYAFNDDGTIGQDWPGSLVTERQINDYGEEQFVIHVPAGATGIVLSNGNGDQTVNITDFDVTGYYAPGERDDEDHLLVVSWKDEPATADSTEPATEEPSEPETEPVTEEPSESATQYVYYDNSYNSWAAPYAYFWIGGTYNSFATWPGGAMESVGNNIYRAEIPSGGYDMVIFNNNGSPQTEDLTIPGDGYIYRYNATINDYEWALYTTEPVTEPETEPETEPVTDPGSEPVPVDAPNNDVYVVSGNDSLFGAWSAVPDKNVMNYYSDGLYRIIFENVEYDPGAIYSFKVVRFQNGESYNNEWIGYNGTNDNVDFSLSQSCDVTIIYNPDTKEIRVEGDSVIPPAYQIDSITAVGVSNGNFLNGWDWDPSAEDNLMEEVEDGVYEITFNDVETGMAYEFKFAANSSWELNWGDNTGNYATTGEYHPAVFNIGDNIRFELDDYEEDYADVTLVLDIRNWDPTTKEGARYAILINGEEPTEESLTVNATSNIAPSYSRTFDPNTNQITVTWWIQAENVKVIAHQFLITYDPSVLQYDTTEGVNTHNGKSLVFRLPGGYQDAVINTSNPGRIKGTGSDPSDPYKMCGENSERIPFYSVTFNPVAGATGSTDVNLEIEELYVCSNNNEGSDRVIINQSNGSIPEDEFYDYIPDYPVAVYEGITDSEYIPDDYEPINVDPQEKHYIYYDNSYNNWYYVGVYFWNDQEEYKPWPGQRMEQVDTNIYRAEIPDGYTNIIFNDYGYYGNQTSDLEIPGEDYIWQYDALFGEYQWAPHYIVPENAKIVRLINTLGWEHPVVYAYDSNGDILPEASASEPVRTASNQRKETVHTFMLPKETASFAFGDGDKLTTTASDHTKTYYTLGDLTPGGEYVLLEDNPNFNFSIKGTIDFYRFINAQVNSNVVSAYRFIPAEDVDIVFTSMSNNDTYGHLYDANGYQIASDDDNGDYSNFRIVYHLTAGQTYYFGCRYYSSSNSGMIPISLEKREYQQQEPLEIYSINAYGNGHNGFLNDYEWRTDENQMTEIQKDVYAISFDNIASDEYSFRFCVNGNGDNYFCDNQWSRQPNTIYDAYYRNSYDCRFYLSEESNVTLIFDAREYDPQTMTGAKYEVIAEPVSSTKQIRSLTLLDYPVKTTYIAGEKVDLTGMTLVALYSDRTSEFVDYCDVSPLVVTEDTTEVTLTYKGLTESFPVTITPAELTSLVLVSTPTQRQYYEGDTLNLDGCVVKAVYNDGAFSKIITDYTVSADLSTPGIKTITLSYGGKSVEFDIVVNKLFITDFWVSRNPDKMEYYRGETFDPTGMELKARYNSGREFTVESYTVNEFRAEDFGNGQGYVRFTIDNLNGGTISTEIGFDVVPRTLAIALTGQPEKTTYINGEPLDTTGLQVYAVMEDGTAHEIPAYATNDEPVIDVVERTIQFTDSQNWGDDCCMISYDAYGNENYIGSYNYYENGFGERTYLFEVPVDAVRFCFENGYGDITETASDMNVAGYYTGSERTQDGSLVLYSWGQPGEGIPTEIVVTDGYTVSELKDRAGRQSITVEYKDKQAYFFVDVFDMGDVNSDGIVSVADVTALQKYLVELNDLDDLQTQLADINGDGEVDVRDATLIQMLISEIV